MTFDFRTTFPHKVGILGAARSGFAAIEYFQHKGCEIFLSDSCSKEKLEKSLRDKKLENIPHEAQGHTERLLDSQLIILSPGVPSDLPILQKAKQKGIPIWSEMELGFRASDATFLAVTGSTGKSTTVSLTGKAIEAAHKQVIVAGNIGIPVISVTPQMPKGSFVVAEVSSFQLENIETFCPKAAAVLNFMKNHLDRYNSEDDYYNAKKQIARNFTKDNFLVLNLHDPKLVAWSKEMKNKTNIIFFGSEKIEGDCFWFDGQSIRYDFMGSQGVLFEVENMKIHGEHNYQNAAVAAALAKIAGVNDSAIGAGICSFTGLAHRLEFSGEVNGVKFYNDSKSTTAESIISAISTFPSGVHLIAGGRDKGCDFAAVNEAIKKHVADITLIGEATDRIESIWKGLAPIYKAITLQDAMTQAFNNSNPGDAIVFSPGCSSFDMFANYEERGNVFKAFVKELAQK